MKVPTGPTLFLRRATTQTAAKKIFLQILKNTIKQNSVNSQGDLDERFAVLARDHIGISVLVDGIYEREAIENIKAILKRLSIGMKDKIFLDVGANIGNHARQLFHLFYSCEAFEPNPDIFELLLFNVKPFSSIHARNFGLGDISRSAILHLDKHNAGASSVVTRVGNEENGGSLEIQLKTLDELKFSKKIGLIKIDTEGMEFPVLKGAERLIAEDKPIVAFEQLTGSLWGPERQSPEVDFLREHGYLFIYEKPVPSGPGRFVLRFRQIAKAAFGLPRLVELVLWDSVPAGRFSLVFAVHNSIVTPDSAKFLGQEKRLL